MRRVQRLLAAFLLAAMALPAASAEWGPYGDDGWPITVDGASTNPFPGLHARDLDTALQAVAAGDPLNQAGGATVYPYWPVLTAEVQRLARDHPDLVRLHTAGKSTLGLDLHMLEICDFAHVAALDAGPGAGDCPGPRGTPREVVWVDGGHHSNEYSGVYFALAFAQFLVEEYGRDANATWIVENRHVWVMPMVNPDGSHAFGRLNANGVNINRNYPVVWDGEGNDALMNNRGPSPASEVETQVNIAWLNLTRPDYYASVHCCGNLWLYPYGEEGIDPVDNAMLQKVCDEAFPAVRDDCGPIWSTIYPASGSSVDTAYEYTGTVAFGYEMSGRGAAPGTWGQPVTFETVRTQEVESWTGLLHAALNVHRYGASPTVTAVQADPQGLLVTVRNDGLGNLTGASFELMFPSGGSSQADVPDLAPGGATTVRLPCTQDGLHELRLGYSKRLVATANQGLRVQSVLLQAPGTDLPLDKADLDVDFAVVRASSAPGEDAPALPLGAAGLALLALALSARRR